MKFHHCCPSWKKVLWPSFGKATIAPPWKDPSDAHGDLCEKNSSTMSAAKTLLSKVFAPDKENEKLD